MKNKQLSTIYFPSVAQSVLHPLVLIYTLKRVTGVLSLRDEDLELLWH